MNFDVKRTFEKGWSTDSVDNTERPGTFQNGVNGRIYSKNGVFSFSSVKGGTLVYENPNIVKYLGGHAFQDELLVFAKAIKDGNIPNNETEICSFFIQSNSFTLTQNTAAATISITNQVSLNATETETCYTETTPPVNDLDFNIDFSCEEAVATEVDFGEYYEENVFVPNFSTCSINQGEIPINNVDYLDVLFSFREGVDGNLIGTVVWSGMQNWPLNGKITTDGVEENEFYKRVYYTDAVNPRRVVNLKDRSLFFRQSEEFNQILNNTLLQPEIIGVFDGGQLKAMKVLYLYRIISENGQVSEFSPSSFFVNVIFDNEAIGYRGGDISELTNKSVKIKCNIINVDPSSQVECVAVEYEALGAPTAIRNLGRKQGNAVVLFQHFGNEEEFSDDITIEDILNFKNTWKYCNDFSSKKNKLIAVGLRNDPIPTEINNLEYLFPLHSWDINGNTHDCLMNPRPWEYRYIDPSKIGKLIFVKRKLYKAISSFGPLTITFKNLITSDSIELNIADLNIEGYSNILQAVVEWLIIEQDNNVNFTTFFPNLTVSNTSSNQILFAPTNTLVETDMSNYVFQSNNDQFIEEFDNDIVFLDVAVETNNLVYGAQSIGFNEGVGVRVTYREFKEPLLNQATAVYDGTDNVLDFIAPSGNKFFMKGEIYRLAFQAYNNDSTRFFSIPIGDVMIPNIGDVKLELDESGNAVVTSQKYVNQSVENGVLYGHGIKMQFEVRLNCQLQEKIPMYQILTVDRDEENRTILCQGIAAPLLRYQHNNSEDHDIPDEVKNKWMLPYYGGPTYEKLGLINYDTYGIDDVYLGSDDPRRTMQSRNLMYFDSPDLYFNKISDQFLASSKINIIGKLNTDHTPGVIRERGGDFVFTAGFTEFNINFGNELYPKFSRKILEDQVEGFNNSEELPRAAREDRESGTFESHFINVSVFSEFQNYNEEKSISKARTLLRGEVISGQALDIPQDISNNAMCLPCQPWFYGSYQRDFGLVGGDRSKSSVIRSTVHSPGYKTTFLKTSTDLFTTEFIGPDIHTVDSQIRKGGSGSVVYDTIPLINIFRNNRENVYGGRTKEAFSRNTYIPLSRTIPTLRSNNGTQKFLADGDTYVTLNIRTKNDYGDDELFDGSYNNEDEGRARGDIDVWKRNGAWAYAVVLESQVESKFSYQYEFYRESGTHSFETIRPEIINEAYFNSNILKSYIPKPFNFKDDPNQGHVIAVSDVKLAGEFYDSWTSFKPNNFYAEIEKNKGDISNIVKEKDKMFVIQRNQTSEIIIGSDRMVADSDGNPINIKQGSGTVVDGHNVISSYGTAVRRAVNENFDYGFVFYDENINEFIKVNQPLFFKNLLHLDIMDMFRNDRVIDSECYFSHEYKETNIRVRTEGGNSYMFSYNEVLGVFNGKREYNQDIFMDFRKKIFAPITTNVENVYLSSQLESLDQGQHLFFQNVDKPLVLGFYLNAEIDKVFQYKQWNAITNIKHNFLKIDLTSSQGQTRTILGTHNWYKIREGNHSVPGVNESNDEIDYEDIRGNWIYVEMTVFANNKEKVDILAIVNSLRLSHQ